MKTIGIKTKILFLLTVTLLLSCNHQEEYVVRDLTTYKSAWKWERQERDSATSYKFSKRRIQKFESRFNIPDNIQRLNHIKKDTQAVAVYFGNLVFSNPYEMRACLISIGRGKNSGVCELRGITGNENTYYSPENPRNTKDLIWRVKLEKNEYESFIKELEEWQIWKRHSFLNEILSTHDYPSFIEVRDGNRYKLCTCTKESYYLLTQLLDRTGVNDQLLYALTESFKSMDTTFHIDSIPNLNHDRLSRSTIDFISQGYFDTDSTWLVE